MEALFVEAPGQLPSLPSPKSGAGFNHYTQCPSGQQVGKSQTCQVSRNFRECPEMGRDLQVSRNCKENSRNWGNLIAKLSLRKKCEFLSYLSQICVSNFISQLENTQKSCYYPPPSPLNHVGSWKSRKILLLPPPPAAESRRLLEITDHGNFLLLPPPLNRVGFWRSRKRLKKFNNLNLAALQVSLIVNQTIHLPYTSWFVGLPLALPLVLYIACFVNKHWVGLITVIKR